MALAGDIIPSRLFWEGTILLTAILLASAAAPSTVQADRCASREAPADQGAIAYRDCGHGLPVLIIPGGPGLDAEYIAPVARMITAMHRRAILIEPRGTGASRAAIGDGSRLTVAGSIADVEAVRRASGADKVVLIGHSFGGGVAQAYAAAFPDRVAGLVLLDSTGPDMQPSKVPLDSWRKRATPEELHRYDAARAAGNKVAAMRLKFRIGFYHRQRGEAFDAALKDSAIHSDVGRLSDDYARNYHIAPLGSAGFPITIIAGDIDWIRGHEPELKATYPMARSITVRHAGHFPWADSPAAFSDALRQALAPNGK
ncbi:hypothetical protein DMC47_33660 [Nostoc sp. 3335mG]|nr:hypothetical protein DMC47_33660 [Nostoc sp. 3335mG]